MRGDSLSEDSLRGASLHGASLHGASLRGASLGNDTVCLIIQAQVTVDNRLVLKALIGCQEQSPATFFVVLDGLLGRVNHPPGLLGKITDNLCSLTIAPHQKLGCIGTWIRPKPDFVAFATIAHGECVLRDPIERLADRRLLRTRQAKF